MPLQAEIEIAWQQRAERAAVQWRPISWRQGNHLPEPEYPKCGILAPLGELAWRGVF